ALLVALVATVQLRSQAEVERSLVQANPATLAFSIDQLSRSNDELEAQINDLTQRRSQLHSGGSAAADLALQAELDQLRILEGLVPVHGPGVVLVIDASGLTALDLQDALNNLAGGGGEALAVNDQRVVAGVPIVQTAGGVAVGGTLTPPPWTIVAIGDTTQVAGHIERLAYVVEKGLAALMDGISACVDQALWPTLLFRQDDLRQHDLRDVIAGVAVHDADVVTGANQVRDSVKRHVLARAG